MFPGQDACMRWQMLSPVVRDVSVKPPSAENHSARGQRYRYVLHPNGTEQVYDHQTDPDEFHNLADKPELDPVKKRLAQWFPKTNANPVSNK